jgi:hypothetical protein
LKEYQPNDRGPLLAESSTLEQGLRLLDEVICFSHCLNDSEIPTSEPLSPYPSCSFCGGELFRTAFLCAGSCVRDGAADDTAGSKVVFCNLCVVDGRTCRCGSMTPYRFQSLEELVNLRAKIADLLDGLVDEAGPGQM